MKYIVEHWDGIMQIFGSIVVVVTLIVKFTETDKDDTVWAKILKVLSMFSLVNPDGSIVGKKEEEPKEEEKQENK